MGLIETVLLQQKQDSIPKDSKLNKPQKLFFHLAGQQCVSGNVHTLQQKFLKMPLTPTHFWMGHLAGCCFVQAVRQLSEIYLCPLGGLWFHLVGSEESENYQHPPQFPAKRPPN